MKELVTRLYVAASVAYLVVVLGEAIVEHASDRVASKVIGCLVFQPRPTPDEADEASPRKAKK